MDVLLNLRKQAGVTQQSLADYLEISRQAYANYENGNRSPDYQTLIKLSSYFSVSVDYLLGNASNPKTQNGIKIPVYGSVAAGIPIEAITDIEDYEEITEDMARTGNFAALKIKGASMEPRIVDGDVVIVKLQDDVDSGDIAIVMVNGDEATCKKIKKTPEGVMLISINPNYEPMFYTNQEIEEKPVKIWGKVVELRAKF